MKIKFPEWNYEKISRHFAVAVNLLFLLVLTLNLFHYLPDYWNMVYIFYFVVFVNTLWIALKIKKIPEDKREKNPLIYIFSYLFLLTLIIFTANQFLKNQTITDWIPHLTALSIGFGFLTFYSHRNKVEKEIEDEKTKEEDKEKKRKEEFDKKFPRINKIWGLRSIVKWMYKEGGGYSLALIGIVVLGFLLRIWNLDYLQGSDNFNLISAKALYQGNNIIYNRNLDLTYLIFLSFKTFGLSLASSKIPTVIIGTTSILLIYFLGKNIDKKTGIFSAILLAISPVAIEKSTWVREYCFNFLILLVVILFFSYKYKINKKEYSLKDVKRFVMNSIICLIILGGYCFLSKNTTFSLVLLIVGTYFMILFNRIYKNTNLKYKKQISILSLLLLFLIPIIIGVSGNFYKTFGFEPDWLRIFFDPNIQFPMQWFSGATLLAPFFISAFIIGFFLYKDSQIKEWYFIFFYIVLLFVFKFNNHLSYLPSRYLFVIYIYYLLLFSVTISCIIKLVKIAYKKSVAKIFLLILFVLFAQISYLNILHGTQHDLQQIWIDGKTVTSLGTRDYYFEICIFLESRGVNNQTTVIVEGENPFFIEWYFNYDLNRVYGYDLNSPDKGYEIADDVFYISSNKKYNEISLALKKSDEGYFISQSWYKENPVLLFPKNYKLTELNKIQGHKVYFWEKD